MAAAAVPRIQYYSDGRHPSIYMYEPPMQREELCQVVDELVRHTPPCPGANPTCVAQSPPWCDVAWFALLSVPKKSQTP